MVYLSSFGDFDVVLGADVIHNFADCLLNVHSNLDADANLDVDANLVVVVVVVDHDVDRFLPFDVVEAVVFVLFDIDLLLLWLDVANIFSMFVAGFLARRC